MVLFAKEKSSLQSAAGGNHQKKGKDVALRKSDRRALWQKALAVFRLDDGNDNDNDSMESTRQEHRRLLQHIFLQGELVKRTLLDPSSSSNNNKNNNKAAPKLNLYLRSPDPASQNNNKNTNNNDNNNKPLSWPYSRSTQAIWIELDNGAWQLPTVALLSAFFQSKDIPQQSPLLLPTITVFPQVSKYLCRGADLMKAGIGGVAEMPPQEASSSNNHNRIVAICIQGNPQPFAIGLLKDSIEELAPYGPGTQGIAALVQTCYGDDLWKQQLPTQQQADEIGSVLAKNTTTDNNNHNNNHSNLRFDLGHYGNPGFLNGQIVAPTVGNAESDGGDSQDENGPATTTETGDATTDGEKETTSSTESAAAQDEESTTLSPDDVLHHATCRALVQLHPKRDLPISMSQFYSSWVLKHRPPGTTVQLKQTRYKKFGAYIQEQVARDLISVGKDHKDPLAQLVGYNARHEDLRPFLQQKKQDQGENSNSTNAKTRLVIADLYRIPNHVTDLLRLAKNAVNAANATSEERKNTGFLTAKEVRAILDDYIDREALVNPKNKGQIILDGPLTDALFKKKGKKGNDNDAPPPTSVTRKSVPTLFQAQLETGYALVEVPGNRILQLARGAPPKVTIEVSRRQSNKFVTKLRGMEYYRIDGQELRLELAQRFACAVALEEHPPEYKLPKNHVELQLQGNLVDEVEALLLGDESLSAHGGAKNSPYQLPAAAMDVVLRKGVPARKKRPNKKKK